MLSIKTELFIILLFLGIGGIFAMAEIAMLTAHKARLKRLAEEGDSRAQAALDLAASPKRFLATVQIGITLMTVLAAVFGAVVLADSLAARLEGIAWLAPHARGISLALVIGVVTFAALLIGELVPKGIALNRPERVALALAFPLRQVAVVAAPLIWVLSGITGLIVKLLGIGHVKEALISDEEVSTLLEQGLNAGVFQEVEKDMVEGVLSLDQLPVTALMTPRPKIVWLNLDDPDEVNWRKIVASRHSQFPVYQEKRDQVLGMLSIKALWAHASIGLPTNIKNLLSSPLIVSENLTAIQLLETFKSSGKHVSLVTDEFGSVQGMVTLIDVLEAIVGDMPSAGRKGQPEARQREDGSWLIDATMPINEIKEMFDFDELPNEEEADYQTLGGFIVTQLGRIPAPGDHFEWGGYRFQVVDMDRRRVDKVLILKRPEQEAAFAQEAS